MTVETLEFEFKSYDGDRGPLRKPVVENGVYAEIVVRDMAASGEGWEAVFVSCFGRKVYKAQPGTQDCEVKLEGFALEVLTKIDANFWKGGVFDVFAWNEATGEVRFYECKRKGKDRIRSTQLDWIRKGLAAGLSEEAFAFVEWTAI